MGRNVVYQPILNFTKYCMIAAGIWPLPLSTENALLLKLYSTYSTFVQIFLPLFLSSLCIQFVVAVTDTYSDNDPDKLFKHVSYIITMGSVEVVVIICQKEKFKGVVSFIVEEEKEIVRSEDNEILKFHRFQVKLCRASNWAVFIFTFGVAISMTIENFLQRAEIEEYNKAHGEEMEKPLPYELYYFGLNKNDHQTLLLVMISIANIMIDLLVASTKMIFISCIIFVPSTLKKLQIKFKKIEFREGNLFVNVGNLAFEHQHVIDFVENLNDLIKYVILLEYLLNSLNLAAVSIQFMTNQQLSPIFYFSFLIIQTFVLGWSANEIKIQSEALAHALYESSWYNQNDAIKKMLLTMILRAQKPLVLTTGPFDAMTTESALRIPIMFQPELDIRKKI
ncbi:odorant receptor 22b-like isoform X2 [Cylas formicarius]|uniref:odorant receptor 22b-like isoform X2 n=1 Tax=Cylas formicarius TaxID=197179 RepID=UPI0029585D17|nr:odorant receptor 22b-like isoform X2 [Cylas formicarius]